MSTVHTPRRMTASINRSRVAAVLIIAVVALVLAISLRTTGGPDMILAPAEQPPVAPQVLDRGHGDPCALRLGGGGGFMEGLDPANDCGEPSGTERTGGRIEQS